MWRNFGRRNLAVARALVHLRRMDSSEGLFSAFQRNASTVVVVDLYNQRIVLAAEETTVTQQVRNP